jgi:hypothetical protein
MLAMLISRCGYFILASTSASAGNAGGQKSVKLLTFANFAIL